MPPEARLVEATPCSHNIKLNGAVTTAVDAATVVEGTTTGHTGHAAIALSCATVSLTTFAVDTITSTVVVGDAQSPLDILLTPEMVLVSKPSPLLAPTLVRRN